MGYLKIPNLYKEQTILLFKECYALEKIHGTSAHITYNPDATLTFFSGGTKYDPFVALFDKERLLAGFKALQVSAVPITVFGEAYGGKEQGMSHTYGKHLKFVAFDVRVGERWLNVMQAEAVAKQLWLDFVHYIKVTTDLKELDAQRDMYSIQAIRNEVSSYFEGAVVNPRPREGVVLRPLEEMTLNNGARVITKHKGEAFRETKTPREVDLNLTQVLSDAQAVADEWVTPMRLQHVLDKIPDAGIEKTGEVLKAMVEDIMVEGAGEIVDSREVRKAISAKTGQMFKSHLITNLHK